MSWNTYKIIWFLGIGVLNLLLGRVGTVKPGYLPVNTIIGCVLCTVGACYLYRRIRRH